MKTRDSRSAKNVTVDIFRIREPLFRITLLIVSLLIRQGLPSLLESGLPEEERPKKCHFVKSTPAVTRDARNRLQITCKDVILTNSSDAREFYRFLQNVPKISDGTELILLNFKYPNRKLRDSWFCQDILQNLNIRSLTLNSGLISIATNGFQCLEYLQRLTIANNDIRLLRKEHFDHIEQLHTLELRSNSLLRTIETGLLNGLRRLTVLQIQNVKLPREETWGFFMRLTGSQSATQIATIDWSYNDFGLFPDISSRFPNVQLLNLQSSQVTGFQVGAIKNFSRLRMLNLADNMIETLQQAEFESLLTQNLSVYIKRNPLRCDCDLAWLQSYIIRERNGSYTDFAEVLCASPKHLKDIPFLKADLCPPEVSSTAEVSTVTPSTWCPMTVIQCTSEGESRIHTELKLGTFAAGDITLSLKSEKQNFTVDHDDITNRLNINIENASGTKKTLLYWSNTNGTQYKCITQVMSNLRVSAHPDTDYVICVFDESENASLLDCKPFRTKQRYSKRAWLTNGVKFEVIVVSVILLLTSLIVGAAVTYFLLRINPDLLSGSKRVIRVKKYEKSPVIVMPKGYTDRTEYFPRETAADTASTASYISPIMPGPSEIMEYHMEKLMRQSKKKVFPQPLVLR